MRCQGLQARRQAAFQPAGRVVIVRASATATFKATKKPSFPFTKIAGQEEMKLALLLNVVDPNIGRGRAPLGQGAFVYLPRCR